MKERIHEEKTEYFDCLLLIAIMAKYEVWYQFNLMIYKEVIIMQVNLGQHLYNQNRFTVPKLQIS